MVHEFQQLAYEKRHNHYSYLFQNTTWVTGVYSATIAQCHYSLFQFFKTESQGEIMELDFKCASKHREDKVPVSNKVIPLTRNSKSLFFMESLKFQQILAINSEIPKFSKGLFDGWNLKF